MNYEFEIFVPRTFLIILPSIRWPIICKIYLSITRFIITLIIVITLIIILFL